MRWVRWRGILTVLKHVGASWNEPWEVTTMWTTFVGRGGKAKIEGRLSYWSVHCCG